MITANVVKLNEVDGTELFVNMDNITGWGWSDHQGCTVLFNNNGVGIFKVKQTPKEIQYADEKGTVSGYG
jgi:hypothetical protein